MPTQPRKGDATQSSRTWDTVSPALAPWILEAVSSMGFSRMTPVQASTIPLFTGNKDVVVEAVTGSGKTLAFLVPVVQRLLRLEDPIKRHHVGAIIISPTRELATQIHAVLTLLLAFHPPSAASLELTDIKDDSDEDEEMKTPPPTFPPGTLKVIPQLLLGGTTTPSQDLAKFLTNSPNVLIATPGRLLELLSSPHVHCPQSSFEVLVMDEADRLLDMGFKEDLQKILQRLPKQRRTGLFSASVSEAVDELVTVGLRNPIKIAVKVRSRTGELDGRTPVALRMTYLTTPASHKLPALIQLIHRLQPMPSRSIAFFSTCAAVDYFQHLLPNILPKSSNLQVIPLHGKHSPQIRQKNFTKFVDSTSPVLLLTTDLAARGLDIPAVDLTVQLDPPSDPKTFIHRAGRAGRAGRRGLSCVFLLPGHETEDYPPFLEVRKTPVESLEDPKVSVSDEDAERAIKKMRSVVLKDRSLHEKAQRAFVSWLQSYSKHTASSIFRVSQLPWDEVAASWALLRMPKMPELKKASKDLWSGDTSLGMEVDWDSYKYKDDQKEKKRIAEKDLSQTTDTSSRSQKPKRRKQAAWSEKLAKHDEREVRRKKKEVRREKERFSKMSTDEKHKDMELKTMIEQLKARS